MKITPNPYTPGGKLTYTITVSNTGTTAATGAQLKAAVAQVWKDIPWTCTATSGSTCPATPGAGDINATVTVAPGGTVTFTADCSVPAGVSVPLQGSAVLTLAGDPNCAGGCTVAAKATAS